VVRVAARTKTLLAWSLWLATLACCAAGLLAALLWIRPLTPGLLATGAGAALAFPLGYASVGLILGLRRPANPIGWLYGAAGLAWALIVPFEPWANTLLLSHRPLSLAGQLAVVFRETGWAPAIALGITLPFLLLPEGRLRSRRWRLLVADTTLGVALLMVGGSLAPGQLTNGPIPIDNPFGLRGPAGRIAGAAVVPGLVLYAISLPAAALFQPLRRRVQDLVDWRFNRRRYDAARTIEAFAARLRDQIDLDALEAKLLAVVEQSVAPTRASLWLRPSAGSQRPT
jgi:hypothetical protein